MSSAPRPARQRVSNPSPVKRRKFVKAILQGKTKYEAAVDAGYSPASASVRATELTRNPEVQSEIERALDKAGATIEAQAKVVAEGFKATKHIGENLIEVADHMARLKAAELSGKFRKQIGSESASIQNNIQLNFIDKLQSEMVQRGFNTNASNNP